MTTATVVRVAKAWTPTPKKTAAPRNPNQRPANARASAPRKTTAANKPSQQRARTEIADRAGPRRPVGRALLAAERAIRRNSLHLQLPIVGEVQLPAPEQVAFIGGVAVMAVIGVLEWPVAALLGLGHGLATNRHSKMMRAFGEALEEA